MPTIFYAAIALLLSSFVSLGLNAFTLLQIVKINDTLRYQTLGFNTTRGEIERAADAIESLTGFDPELNSEIEESLAESARLQKEVEDLLELHQILEDAEAGKADLPDALDDHAGSAQALKQILEEMSPIISDPQTPFAELFPDAENLAAVQTRVERMNELVDRVTQSSESQAFGEEVQDATDFWSHDANPAHA